MIEKILDWFYGVITNPVDTLRDVAKDRPVGWAFSIYLVTSFFASALAAGDIYALWGMSPSVSITLGVFISAVSIFIVTGLLHLFSRMFRGEGGYWNLFSATGFAQFPAFLLPPASLFGELFGGVGDSLAGIFSIAVSIWVFALSIIALRESREISTGASIATYLVMLIALVILLFFPILLLVVILPHLAPF